MLPLVTWSANRYLRRQRAHVFTTLVTKQRKFNATETLYIMFDRPLQYALIKVSSSTCELCHLLWWIPFLFIFHQNRYCFTYLIKYHFLKSKHLSFQAVTLVSNFTQFCANNNLPLNSTVLMHSNFTVSILNRLSTSTEMADVREQLLSIEEKYKRFKQQQFIFITALERSREHARDKTEPVSTVAQVMMHS